MRTKAHCEWSPVWGPTALTRSKSVTVPQGHDIIQPILQTKSFLLSIDEYPYALDNFSMMKVTVLGSMVKSIQKHSVAHL